MHHYVLIKSVIKISLNLQQCKTRLIHDSGYLANLESKTQNASQDIMANFPAKLLKVEVKDIDLKDPYKLLCGQALCAIVSKNEKGNIILNYVEPKNITVIKEIK